MIRFNTFVERHGWSALIVFWLAAGDAHVVADGKVFVWRNEKADVFQPAQKAVIDWDGTTETLTIQTKYSGPAEELAWIVPVPSKPTVKRGDAKIFELMSKRTQEPDIAYTDFSGPAAGMAGRGPLEWRKRVGAYDVALLSPVGAESVIQWLKQNEYGVDREAEAVLEAYVQKQWWVVASKIHRDALTAMTRERLTSGTLHPLEMTFASDKCVYPFRLTSQVAGPVEILLYIEGENHMEPATVRGSGWTVRFYGGPYWAREPRRHFRMVRGWDMAYSLRDAEAKRMPGKSLTKLRRVFQPEDMTDDIFFQPVDYADYAASTDTRTLGEVATQYGRRRSEDGIPHLVKILSSDKLPDQPHIRSAVWALGQVGLDGEVNPTVEKTLIRCAQQGEGLVRREAWLALAKCGSVQLGPTLLAALNQELKPTTETERRRDLFRAGLSSYTDVGWATSWLDSRATGAVRQAYIDLAVEQLKKYESFEGLAESLKVGTRPTFDRRDMERRQAFSQWLDREGRWAVDRAAILRDPQFVAPLLRARKALTGQPPQVSGEFFLVPLAACGHEASSDEIAQRLVDQEDSVLQAAQAEGDYSVVGDRYGRQKKNALRTRIRMGGRNPSRSYQDKIDVPGFGERPFNRPQLPGPARDLIVRKALGKVKSDWYKIYLLSWNSDPKASDVQLLHDLWKTGADSEGERRARSLIATDVLYRWGKADELARVVQKGGAKEVVENALWALVDLRAPEAAPYVEKAIREIWDRELAGAEKLKTRFEWSRTTPFRPTPTPAPTPIPGPPGQSGTPRPRFDKPDRKTTPKAMPPDYLGYLDSPVGEPLLMRLCADKTLNPKTRFILVTNSLERNPPMQPYMASLTDELVEGGLSLEEFRTVTKYLYYGRMPGKLLDLWSDGFDTPKQAAILGPFLGTADGRAFPVIEKVLCEIWLKRAVEDGRREEVTSYLNSLKEDIEKYCEQHGDLLDLLEEMIRDRSVDLEYRVQLLRIAPDGFQVHLLPAMRELLKENVTDSARKDLEARVDQAELAEIHRVFQQGGAESVPRVTKLLREEWLKRYRKSGGESEPFRRGFRFNWNMSDYVRRNPQIAPVLETLARDESLPLDYRVFIICGCPEQQRAKMIPMMKELAMRDLPQELHRSIDYAIQQTEQYLRSEAMRKNFAMPPLPPRP